MDASTDTAITRAAEQRVSKQLKAFDDVFDKKQSMSSKRVAKGGYWIWALRSSGGRRVGVLGQVFRELN